jgi:hypothetical protein
MNAPPQRHRLERNSVLKKAIANRNLTEITKLSKTAHHEILEYVYTRYNSLEAELNSGAIEVLEVPMHTWPRLRHFKVKTAITAS